MLRRLFFFVVCSFVFAGPAMAQYTSLTVVVTGGMGTVTSSPAGINCGSDCTEELASGASLTLTAEPAEGSVFTGWMGACTGTDACTITAAEGWAAKTVGAVFALDPPPQTWYRRYSPIGSYSPNVVITQLEPAEDGGFLGFLNANFGEGYDYLFKLDSAGDVTWQRSYPRGSVSAAFLFVPLPDGYFTMTTSSSPLFTKLDPSGETLWGKTLALSPAGTFRLHDAIANNSGGALIAGKSYSDPSILSVDGAGQVEWARQYQASGYTHDFRADIQPVGDTGYVYGTTDSSAFRLMRVDLSGEVVWARSYTLGGFDYLFGSLAVTPDNGCIFVGRASGNLVVVRVSDTGQVIWARVFPALRANQAGTVGLFPDGSFLVAANSSAYGQLGYAWAAKLSENGDVIWEKVYGSANFPSISAVLPLADGSFLLAGGQPISDTGSTGWALLADADGQVSDCIAVHTVDSSPTEPIVVEADVAVTSAPLAVSFSDVAVNPAEEGQLGNMPVCPGPTALSVSAGEGEGIERDFGNAATVNVPVSLSPPSQNRVIVAYRTQDLEAKAGADYLSQSGTVIFEPGQTERTIQIQLMGDTIEEPDESFLVVLTDAGDASIATPNGAAWIRDDDSYHLLTVAKGGTGTGTVQGATVIHCGSSCTAPYKRWTEVSLYAFPDPGSVLDHWSGACSGTQSCTVTLDSPKTVTAYFREEFGLSVNWYGIGTVSSAGGEILCGTDCWHGFPPGAAVTLTAEPGPGYTFAGWLGACEGTGVCALTMDRNIHVLAQFDRVPSSLRVSRSGAGSGTVQSSGTAINCGQDCEQAFTPDTAVALVARADPGSRFIGWTGDCTGVGLCRLVMSSDKSVDAAFEPFSCSYSLSVNSVNVSSAAGEFSVDLTADSACAWDVQTYVPWVSVVSPHSGSGNATLVFAVAANTGPARTTRVPIGDLSLIVTQEAGCSVAVSPLAITVDEDGGGGSIDVTAACEWEAASLATWITLSGPARGAGNGTVAYTVAANPSSEERQGNLVAAGQIVTITQLGEPCAVDFAPPPAVFGARGGTWTISVTAPVGCSWTAESSVPWLVPGREGGTGSGDLSYTVSANSTGTDRTGTFTVHAREFQVTQAGMNVWHQVLPGGASTGNVVTDPSNPGVAYLAVPQLGVLKTTDAGLSWQPSRDGLSTGNFSRIVMSPVDSRVLWVTDDSKVYRSTDAGATWTNLPLLTSKARGVTPDPSQPGVLYGSSTQGIWKAADGVSPVVFPNSPADVYYLVVDPHDSSHLYAASNRTIYRSTDAGITWGTVWSSPTYSISELLPGGGVSSVIYAVTGTDGLLATRDHGATWTTEDTGVAPGDFSDLTILDADPAEMYLSGWRQIRKSTDGGGSWTDFAPGPGSNSYLAVLPVPEGRILLATGPDLLRWSESEGWNLMDGGHPGLLSYVSASPVGVREVYASGETRFFATTDQGATWSRKFGRSGVHKMVSDPANPMVRYAYGFAVYKTTDGGETWTQKKWPLGRVEHLAIDPANPLRLYAMIGSSANSKNYSLSKSVDGGETWKYVWHPFPGGGPPSVFSTGVIFPSGPGVIYAGTDYGLYKSTDLGETWSQAWANPYYQSYNEQAVRVLLSDPANPDHLFLTTDNVRAESADGGNTWSYRPGGGSDLAVDFSNPSRMFVVNRSSLYQTLNGGSSWSEIRVYHMSRLVSVVGCAIDPLDPATVYLATYNGVFAARLGPQCLAELDSSSAEFGPAGGAGTVALTASHDCPWTAVSDSHWLTVTSGAAGSGNGSVTYQVSALSGPEARVGGIRVAGNYHAVTQQPPPCTYSLPSSSATISSLGGTAYFQVVAANCYDLRATSQEPWIEIRAGSSPRIDYFVYWNPGAPRTGIIRYGNQEFTVHQECGCPLSASPASRDFTAAGGSGTVNVTAGGECAWAASSSVPWITFPGEENGAGYGSVGYTVHPNPGAARSGMVSIGLITLSIIQAADPTRIEVFFTAPDKGLYQLNTDRSAADAAVSVVAGGGASTHAAAMAVFNDRQYIAVKGATDLGIYIKSRARYGSFADSSWTQVPGSTSASPALCAFNNRLYLFVKGSTNASIYYSSMDSSGVWSGWSQISGSNTVWRPGLFVFGDRLYCFLTDANSNRIRYKSMSTAGTWSPWYEIPTGSTNAAPTAVVQGGKIWLFVKGLAGKVLWWCSTGTPETTSSWSPWTSCNGSSEAAPAVAFNPGDNLFHLLVRGNMVPRIWHRTLDPASLAWSDWHLLTNLDPAAQSIDAPTVVPAAW